MVVEYARPLVEAPCVPRISEAELLEIEMVTKLVAQGAQECAERRDLLTNRRPHPDANQHAVGSVVAEQLERPVLPRA